MATRDGEVLRFFPAQLANPMQKKRGTHMKLFDNFF